MTLATDFAWTDGDVPDDWAADEDPRATYVARLSRLLTCEGLWYAPTRTTHVREYMLDLATDAQIGMRVQAIVDGDEETARSVVRVRREVTRAGSIVVVEIEAHSRRGFTAPLTLAIDSVTGETLAS